MCRYKSFALFDGMRIVGDELAVFDVTTTPIGFVAIETLQALALRESADHAFDHGFGIGLAGESADEIDIGQQFVEAGRGNNQHRLRFGRAPWLRRPTGR